MADLDALFGAFDGEDDRDQAGVDAPLTTDSSDFPDQSEENALKKSRVSSDDDDNDIRDEVNKSHDKNDDLNGAQQSGKAKAVSTMYADVFSSMNHAVGHTQKKFADNSPNAQEPCSTGIKSGCAAASTATVIIDENREVATGTSLDKSIRSYSAMPDGPLITPTTSDSEGTLDRTRPPAKVYPFTLDPFQQTAISYVEKNESVLVAAHTSAGKTVVAEYAIAKSLRDGQRVVYTSPIKALSNQKYRDLQEEFDDVGLMTGDITINPSATCLVMTTEILRSMLYRGSEVMREVAWVVYDEVHYMRDKERGVVWEESIILLPHKVRFVFLSATIPNARQFVSWIAKIHHQPCHVVYTNYRPTPLQHYIFPQGGDGLHLVVDEKGKFRESNFQKAMSTLQGGGGVEGAIADAMAESGNGKGGGGRGQKRKFGAGGGKGPNNDLHRIVKLVMTRNLNPVIVFSFSKKECEKYALELKREDYTDEIEKDLISQVFSNAIESLSEDDRKLPQVEALLPLLKRGIGIHHGGLLPILKEIVEILFSEGLIKCLFATETFAIGINMPAKTVVFTNTRKWDGKEMRWVTSGEYIQMSGRAGRRGKDDRGVVIQMMDEKMEPTVCKGILYGDPDPLNSSYRISYNMLLNMLRVEDVDPEYLLRASFHQYQQESEAPALEAQADQAEEDANAIEVTPGNIPEDVALVGEYFGMDKQLLLTQRKMMKIQRRPEHILPFVQSGGRLIDVTIDGENYGWGIIVRYKRKAGTGTSGSAGQAALNAEGPLHNIDVLLGCVDRHFDDTSPIADARREDLANLGLLWRGTARHCRPALSKDNPELVTMREFTVGLENIDRISAVRLFVPQDTKPQEARKNIMKSLNEVQRRFPEGLPLLDPVKDLKINVVEFNKLLERASELKERLALHKLSTEIDEDERVKRVRAYELKSDKLESARLLRREAKACQTLVMKEDLRKMKRVLKELGHVDGAGVIQTKGRAACEVNTANELVVVELLFAGIFNDLTVEQSVSLLSCLIFDERSKDEDDPAKGLKSYLSAPYYKLIELARTVAKVAISCKIELNEDEFVEKFNPGLMEAVYAWVKGAKFVEVQKLTGFFEGSTIRALRRLEELLRQLASASKAIGNLELQAKFEKGSDLLKRDIVFCSSLYL